MGKKIARDRLCGRWLHSQEEDTDTQMVFRPDGYAFPPARGRIGFQLNDDGTAIDIGIAPADGPLEANGDWKLDEDGPPKLSIRSRHSGTQVFEVDVADGDRIVVKKR